MESEKVASSSPLKRFYRHWSFRLLMLLLAVLAVRAYQQRGIADGKAPPLAGADLSGMPVSLQTLRGETVLVHFWASWCGVCQTMAGDVEDLSRDYQVITVASLSGSAEDIGAYLKQKNLSFPVLVDPEGRLAAEYGVSSFPTSFIIDKAGEISSVEVGYTTKPGLKMRLWMAGHR